MLRALLQKMTGRGPSDTYVAAVTAAAFRPELSHALTVPLTRDEQRMVDRIEDMRRRIEGSSETVDVIDYGAGGPNSNRSKAEMAAGVAASRKIGELCAIASKPPVWAQVLFRLVRHLRVVNCIEMGTCLGISASYIAAALKLNNAGNLITLEGSPKLAEKAQSNVQSLGFSNVQVRSGRFSETLLPALQDMQPVDFTFVDGHHDRDATLEYFSMVRPYLAQKNVIIFDDITWSAGMKEAWGVIQQVTQGHSLNSLGVCLNVH